MKIVKQNNRIIYNFIDFILLKKRLIIYFIIMWILISFAKDVADYASYSSNYYAIGKGLRLDRFEILFTTLIVISNKLGFTYNHFIIILSTIELIIIFSFVIRYSNRPCMVLTLYFIFPFFYDIVQIRNALSYAIILFGIRYLENYSTTNLFKYLFTVLIASMIHSSAIFYLSYILVYHNSLKKIIRFVLIIFIIELMMIFFMPGLIFRILSVLSVDLSYLSNNIDISKMIQYSIVSLVLILITSKIIHHDYNNKIDVLIKVSPFILITTPFMIYNQVFYRFFRNSLLIFYIIFLDKKKANTNHLKIKMKKTEFLTFATVLIISLYFYNSQLSSSAPGYELLTKAIFENNDVIKAILQFF